MAGRRHQTHPAPPGVWLVPRFTRVVARRYGAERREGAAGHGARPGALADGQECPGRRLCRTAAQGPHERPAVARGEVRAPREEAVRRVWSCHCYEIISWWKREGSVPQGDGSVDLKARRARTENVRQALGGDRCRRGAVAVPREVAARFFE